MEMLHDESRLRRVEVAIEAMRRGEMVILVDDEDRENEGDLCMAAEFVTPEAINFMAKEARGLICLTLTPTRCEELALPIMIEGDNTSQFHTNFTVSIDAVEGISTGISAPDPAHTIKLAVSPHCRPKDLQKPSTPNSGERLRTLLEQTWPRFCAENGPKPICYRSCVVLGRICKDFGKCLKVSFRLLKDLLNLSM